MDHFVWDDELLPFLAAIDSFVKKTVLYEDNGRLQQAGVPYGRTRIHLYFKADGIEIKVRHHIMSLAFPWIVGKRYAILAHHRSSS